MAWELNSEGAAFAHSLISSGAVERTAPWSWDAADGHKILGPGGDDWEKYGKIHLAIDRSQPEKTEQRYGYPFAKDVGGKMVLFSHALHAIASRASAQGETAIENAVEPMEKKLAEKKLGGEDKAKALGDAMTIFGEAIMELVAQQTGNEEDGAQQPETANPKGTTSPPLARFKMTANTGSPMRLAGWKHPVVMDMSGMQIPSQVVPIRKNHDVNQGVGHTTELSFEKGNLMAKGIISRKTIDAEDVRESARNGFPWKASIGATAQDVEFLKPGEKGAVNGKEYEGPLNIVRKSNLGEISFVDLAADPQTNALIATATGDSPMLIHASKDGESGGGAVALSAAEETEVHLSRMREKESREAAIKVMIRAASEKKGADLRAIQEVAQKAFAEGWDTTKLELELLRASRARPVHPISNEQVPTQKVLECSLALACGIPDKTLAEDRDYGPDVVTEAWSGRNRGLVGTVRAALEAAGVRAPHGNREMFEAVLEHREIRAGGFSTINLPGILGNVANKVLLEAFTRVDATYDRVAQQADYANFYMHSIFRLEHLGDFELVANNGELKHGALGQDYFTNKVDTYGQLLTLTRQQIINDDLNAFRSLTAQLARKARIAVEKALYTLVLDPTNTFYTAGNGNLLTSSSLGVTELGAAEAALLQMADANKDPIYAIPRFILVPPQLRYLGSQLYSSKLVNDYAGGPRPTDNPFAGRFEPVTSPFMSAPILTNYSATTWYMLADPLMLPAFEVAYLDGRRQPTIETHDAQFNVLGLQMRAYWDFGVAALDPRGAIKNTA